MCSCRCLKVNMCFFLCAHSKNVHAVRDLNTCLKYSLYLGMSKTRWLQSHTSRVKFPRSLILHPSIVFPRGCVWISRRFNTDLYLFRSQSWPRALCWWGSAAEWRRPSMPCSEQVQAACMWVNCGAFQQECDNIQGRCKQAWRVWLNKRKRTSQPDPMLIFCYHFLNTCSNDINFAFRVWTKVNALCAGLNQVWLSLIVFSGNLWLWHDADQIRLQWQESANHPQ